MENMQEITNSAVDAAFALLFEAVDQRAHGIHQRMAAAMSDHAYDEISQLNAIAKKLDASIHELTRIQREVQALAVPEEARAGASAVLASSGAQSEKPPEKPKRLGNGQRTPGTAFHPHILAALRQLGGRATFREMIAAMTPAIDSIINEDDRQPSPHGRRGW